jgi:hypothetical protein
MRQGSLDSSGPRTSLSCLLFGDAPGVSGKDWCARGDAHESRADEFRSGENAQAELKPHLPFGTSIPGKILITAESSSPP